MKNVPVLDVHSVQARLPVTPASIVAHKKKGQRARSRTLCLSYLNMRYIATAMQNYCINKELIERGNSKLFA